MKSKQLRMDSELEELDRYQLARERREVNAILDRLDTKYGRATEGDLKQLPAGSVVIIGQDVFRNEHYTKHFYRTVMNFSRTMHDPKNIVFVQADNEEWPDIPPWAGVMGHDDELKDISFYQHHMHWATGEVVEPIETWWMKKWEVTVR